MWDQEKEVIVETVREMNLKSGCRNDEIKVGAERKRVCMEGCAWSKEWEGKKKYVWMFIRRRRDELKDLNLRAKIKQLSNFKWIKT